MMKNPGDAKSILYLSEKRTMFIGRLAPRLTQATAASTLIMSLDNTLEIADLTNQRTVESQCFLIPAGSQVTINTNDSLLAICFLDALGIDLAILKSRMQNEINIHDKLCVYSGFLDETQVIAAAMHLYEFSAPAEFAFARLEQWIGKPGKDFKYPYDPRVEKAVDLIKSSILENTPVEMIAKELNLSVPRLSQIFKQVTGVPIRRYRLWHRIFITAVKMAWGMSLTEASVSSGFSDSAHFSRVFKEIGGIKPSAVLNGRSDTLILMLPPKRKIQSRSPVPEYEKVTE